MHSITPSGGGGGRVGVGIDVARGTGVTVGAGVGVAVGDGAGMGVGKSIGVGEMVETSVDVAAGVVAEGVGVG